MRFNCRIATSYHLALAGLLVLILGLSSESARAATATSTFGVTATVQAKCRISAVALAFGSYDPTSATPLDATSTITVRCNKNKAYDIGLNAGTFSGATVTTRKMSGPDAAGLAYALTQDSGYATNWGETVGTDTKNVASATGSNQDHTVYGRIAIEQFVVDGAYSDTITATITY